MSSSSAQRQRLSDLYRAGKCVRCMAPHSDISAKTGRPSWRCKDCRADYLVERKQREATRTVVVCECGRKVTAPRQKECVWCRMGKVAKPAPLPRLRIPAHRPHAVFTQHDPIRARYQWATAVGR